MANVKTITVDGVTYTIVDSTAVHKDGTETITGQKTFTGRIQLKDPQQAGTMGAFQAYDAGDIMIGKQKLNESNLRYFSNYIRFKGDGGVAVQAEGGKGIELSGTTVTVPTVTNMADTSQKAASTSYINRKFQYVTALPTNVDANTFYFVKES